VEADVSLCAGRNSYNAIRAVQLDSLAILSVELPRPGIDRALACRQERDSEHESQAAHGAMTFSIESLSRKDLLIRSAWYDYLIAALEQPPDYFRSLAIIHRVPINETLIRISRATVSESMMMYPDPLAP
jgi:hypothetical protein